jgi:hypothetical protein
VERDLVFRWNFDIRKFWMPDQADLTQPVPTKTGITLNEEEARNLVELTQTLFHAVPELYD